MNRRIVKIAVWSVVIVLYTLFAAWRCSFIAINSDFANLVLEGSDILSGNFLRNGWNLTGISFLTTDLIYFIMGVSVFGTTNTAYICACALMQTAMVVVAIVLINDIFRNDVLLNGLLIASFALVPSLFAINMLRAHTGVFILSFLQVFLFIKIKENTERKYILIGTYVVALALSVMGDPIVLIMVTMPICLWSFILWIREEFNTKELGFVLHLNCAGVLIGTVIDRIYFKLGTANKNGFLGQKCFASLSEIKDKFIIYMRSILLLSDAAFEGQKLVQVKTLFLLLNTLALILFFVLVFFNMVCFIMGKKYDFITTILGFGFLMMSLLFVMTSISVDENSARYICYLPMLIAVVLARNAELFFHIKNRFYNIGLVCLIIIVCGNLYSITTDVKQGKTEQSELADFLEKNNMKNGYSSFWNASSTTVLSNGKVTVRAILGQSNRFEMYNWFCKNEWYSTPAYYVVTTQDDPFGVTEDNMINILGAPKQTLELLSYRILVYDYDINELIYNGLSDGILNASEWLPNEYAYLTNGKMHLEEGGMLYGPYCHLDAGDYTITLYGNDIQDIEYDIYSNAYGCLVDRTTIDEDDIFSTIVSIPVTVDDVEIRLFNTQNRETIIEKLMISSM